MAEIGNNCDSWEFTWRKQSYRDKRDKVLGGALLDISSIQLRINLEIKYFFVTYSFGNAIIFFVKTFFSARGLGSNG